MNSFTDKRDITKRICRGAPGLSTGCHINNCCFNCMRLTPLEHNKKDVEIKRKHHIRMTIKRLKYDY